MTLTANQWVFLEQNYDCSSTIWRTNQESKPITAVDVIAAVTVLQHILNKKDEADTGIETMPTTLLMLSNASALWKMTPVHTCHPTGPER